MQLSGRLSEQWYSLCSNVWVLSALVSVNFYTWGPSFPSQLFYTVYGVAIPLHASPGWGVYPSCLQTTAASLPSHLSSQTVPHRPCRHSSTLPSYWVLPSARRTAPVVQLRVSSEWRVLGNVLILSAHMDVIQVQCSVYIGQTFSWIQYNSVHKHSFWHIIKCLIWLEVWWDS